MDEHLRVKQKLLIILFFKTSNFKSPTHCIEYEHYEHHEHHEHFKQYLADIRRSICEMLCTISIKFCFYLLF